MEMVTITKERAPMSAAKTPDALEILLSAYSGDGSTKPKLWHLRNEQLDLLEKLSERYSESQVSVLRAIIDEWREMKIREMSG